LVEPDSDSHSIIAGSSVIAVSICGKLARHRRRCVRFWLIISRCEPTPSLLVANQSCQVSVIRSISCARERTMRSSHHSTSLPQAS